MTPVNRDFFVPGSFYDETLDSIFEEQKRTGEKEFKPIAAAHGIPEDDHDPENNHESNEAGIFLALVLLFGILLIVIKSRLLPKFPTAISTLITGIVFAMVYRATSLPGPSREHFMNIDSEYIVFGFTPLLILGEILKMDIRVAKRMLLQFFYYGLIGGVVNSLITAGLLRAMLPEKWQFELLFSIAALMSTADASFVGHVLHSLGVPHRVVLCVEGEAFANDPALFASLSLAKQMYTRVHLRTSSDLPPVDPSEAIAMVSKIVIAGIALGAVMGVLSLGMINFTSNRFEETNVVLQVVISVLCCYMTFFLAEGVFGMSGALAVVTAGWILAWKMWPKIINKTAMTSFWHTLDFISESLLYLVVGFYVGYESFEVPFWKCFGWSLAIWAIALVVRLATLCASYPIFKSLGPTLHFRELFLWAWCSLKSRIGLALIIEFSLHLLEESTDTIFKREVIFIVGMVFILSNLINGGLAGTVAKLLKLDRSDELEEKIQSMFYKYAVLNAIKTSEALGPYLEHTAHFCLEGEDHEEESKHADHEAVSSKAEGEIHERPSSLGIDWEELPKEELVGALRAIYLRLVKSLYWQENETNKVSIRAIQSLLTATDRSLDEAEKVPINDFYHLMVGIPSRDSKTNHYRVIYILSTFAEAHMTARDVFGKDLLQPVSDSGLGDAAMISKLQEAWNEVREESLKSSEFAKREIAVRFNHDEMSQFFELRNLRLRRVRRVMQDFRQRQLISERDSEESHEAFVEDLEAIKGTMRSIGEGQDEHQGSLSEETFLLTHTPDEN